MVLHAHRHVVAGLQPGRSQEAAEPVGRGIEFGEGLGEARPGHDESRLVAVVLEMCAGEHAGQRSRPIPCAHGPSPVSELMAADAADVRSTRPRCSSPPCCSRGSTYRVAGRTRRAGRRLSDADAGRRRPFLFDEEHFVGNRTAYYDWRNSCLDRVIATRTGIPISLSLLMIEVARRSVSGSSGLACRRTSSFGPDDADAFFDPFAGGNRLDRAEARSLFEGLTRTVGREEDYLEPTPNRDIVIRMLNNLKSVFAGRSDQVRLGLVMGLRAAVPESPNPRLQRSPPRPPSSTESDCGSSTATSSSAWAR